MQNNHPGIEIILRWTPGHEGITGNEWEDKEAKRAAKGESSEKSRLPTACRGEMPCSQLAACQDHRKRINEKSREWFEL